VLKVQYPSLSMASEDRNCAATTLADELKRPPSVSYLRRGTPSDGMLRHSEIPHKVELNMHARAINYHHTKTGVVSKPRTQDEKAQICDYVIHSLLVDVDSLARSLPSKLKQQHLVESTGTWYGGEQFYTFTLYPYSELYLSDIANAFRQVTIPHLSEKLCCRVNSFEVYSKGLPRRCRLCSNLGHMYHQCKKTCTITRIP